MSHMKILLLCFSLLALITAQSLKPLGTDSSAATLRFKSTNDNFERRISSTGTWNLGIWSGVWWNSLQWNVHNDSVSGDYIWGSIYAGTLLYPANWVAYFAANLNDHRNVPDKAKFDWANFTVDKSSSFIASSWLNLTEKNVKSGAVAKSFSLNLLKWTYNSAESTSMSNPKDGIAAAVFDGTSILDPFKIQLIYIMTAQAGVLDTEGDPLIIPKAIESLVRISDWKYVNKDNALSLLTVVGTGDSSWTGTGHLSAGRGDEKVFFRVADTALVDGHRGKVKFNASGAHEGSAAFHNPEIALQLQARYKGSVSVTYIEVQFPAGANSIEYDPTVGVGSDPYITGLDVGLIVGVVVGSCLFLALVIVFIYYVFGKRSSYETVNG